MPNVHRPQCFYLLHRRESVFSIPSFPIQDGLTLRSYSVPACNRSLGWSEVHLSAVVCDLAGQSQRFPPVKMTRDLLFSPVSILMHLNRSRSPWLALFRPSSSGLQKVSPSPEYVSTTMIIDDLFALVFYWLVTQL